MKAKILLDSHVPVDVAKAIRALSPAIDVQHVTEWESGSYLNAPDDLLLEACWQDRRALVSQDRSTLPGWMALRIADGQDHGGVLFYDSERFSSVQIGALAKAIVSAVKQTKGRLLNRWFTLR